MADNFEEKMPQFLHLPIQVMWFDANELTFLALLYMLCSLLGGWAWLLMLLLPYPVLKYKRSQQRGFFLQILYILGVMDIQGYPDASAKQFRE